jgi:hypothetical protein
VKVDASATGDERKEKSIKLMERDVKGISCDLQFNPKSCNVRIAGFDMSPWMATRTSPLSVGTRRRSQALLMESREWDCCNCTERSSMSSSSAGIVLEEVREKVDCDYQGAEALASLKAKPEASTSKSAKKFSRLEKLMSRDRI